MRAAQSTRYRNPKPITIAKADATRDGSTVQVFIELRAPGYPGSTYTLTDEPGRDQLEGIDVQAALQQRFDVTFVRMNSGGMLPSRLRGNGA